MNSLHQALDAHEEAFEKAYSSLDGKAPVKPVPFDAHEQATRGTHVPTSADGPEPEVTGSEYPKAVDHVDHPSGVGLQPVIVNSAEEEAAYHELKKAEAEKLDTDVD
jgi:hypothetical protein